MRALADPKIKTRLADLGGNVLPGSPADFGKLIANETEKWAKLIRFAGIKPEIIPVRHSIGCRRVQRREPCARFLTGRGVR